MRYKLDIDGYVSSVAFGCYMDGCSEYTGEVPIGYNDLDSWASYACINAYYLDSKGNLTLDFERLVMLNRKIAQEAVDNEPLLRKDLYGSNAILDSQYKKGTASGEVVFIKDIQTIAPKVKITGIQPYEYGKLRVFTQSKNMMPCDAITQTIADVSFKKLSAGVLSVNGTATEDIEYTIAGSNDNTTPLFALKAGHNYYLNLGGLECELRYFDGETILQQYVGASGLIKLSETVEVTQVVVKIASGTTVAKMFYPQLEYGIHFSNYEEYKCKMLEIDFSEHIVPRNLYPSDTLYASDTLYPADLTYFVDTTVEYILVENGVVYASINGIEQVVGSGNVGLFSDYNIIYATHDTNIDIEYSTNVYDVSSLEFLQGKETTTQKFRILKDGSIEAYNGYFGGTIFSEDGYIGGWNIKGHYLCSGTTWGEDMVFMCTGTDSDYTIGGKKTNGWVFGAGSTFGVTKAGAMYCTYGKIGGNYINGDGIYFDNGDTGYGLWGTTKHSNIAIHAGTSTSSEGGIGAAPFKVYHDGRMESTRGNIGGWEIDKDCLEGSPSAGYSVKFHANGVVYNGKPFFIVVYSNGTAVAGLSIGGWLAIT